MSATAVDIAMVAGSNFGPNNAILYNVAAGATTINDGEPVVNALAGVTVTAMATNKPVVA